MAFDARYERELECTDCHEVIIVGGCFDDIDPYTYRGVACGCRREKPRNQTATPSATGALAETMERARAAQGGRR